MRWYKYTIPIIIIATNICNSSAAFKSPFNHWYCIDMVKHIDKSKPYAYKIGELPLVTWFNESQPLTTLNICQHMGSKLDKGSVKNGCLVCPYHGIKHTSSDVLGKTVIFEDKLWWSYKSRNKLPVATPYYKDKEFETLALRFDIDSNIQDFVMNTFNMNHLALASRSQNYKYKLFEHKLTMNYDCDTSSMLSEFNFIINDMQKITNYQIFQYPHSVSAIFAFKEKDRIAINANMLPLGPNKSRVFLTIKHNFWKSYFGKLKLEGIVRYFIRNNQIQMSNQYDDNMLKKTALLQKTFNNDNHLKHLQRMFKEYEYPDMISTMRLYNHHYKS
jgi:hypothetical protein